MHRLFALVVLLAPALVCAADLQVDREPSGYLILGSKGVRAKNLTITPPGCNIGVDCPVPVRGSGRCGVLNMTNASVPPNGQVVSDRVCLGGAPGSLFAVFRGADHPQTCGLNCGMIQNPGPLSDCTFPFDAPILGDLDGDGHPSCDDHCNTDLDDIARACGITLPFPACDPGHNQILVTFDHDCSSDDILPGNHRCDLAPGKYGAIRIQNAGELVFGAGQTVICSLTARVSTIVRSSGPANVLVPGGGVVKFHNDATVGTECDTLRIVTERGTIKFSRNGHYVLDACAVAGTVNLGGDNLLRGHFVGGVTVAMDPNNHGECCPTTSTSTTTTTTTATTSTSTSSTTTTSTSTTVPTTAQEVTTTSTTSTTTSTTAPTTTSTSTTASTTTESSTTTVSTTTSTTTTTEVQALGCRVTGGGNVIGTNDDGDMFKATFGGQVGAPCGCVGCFSQLDPKAAHVQGNWTYRRKSNNGSFKAQSFNSLVCGCEGELVGGLCTPGPPPRTPANTICVSGVGGFTEKGSARQGDTVVFRLEVKDFGEPGRDDHLRIRMWPVNEGDDVDALAAAVCCTKGEDALPPAPVVDDDSDLIGGNIQIHPELGKSEDGICPPPGSACVP